MPTYYIDDKVTYDFTNGESGIFSSGGVASACKVSSGAWVGIGVYGAAEGTVVSSGGSMSFLSGCFSGGTNTVRAGGILAISSGATVKSVTADNGAILELTMAGEWFKRPTKFTVTSGGTIIRNLDTTSTTADGIVVCGFTGWDMKTSGCTLDIFDWASAASVKVSSGCRLTVGSRAPYGPGAVGTVDVYNGGVADLYKANGVGVATVHSGGTMYLNDLENVTVMEDGGYMDLADERILSANEYYDPNVRIKPNSFSKLVLGGDGIRYIGATVHSGTTAVDITLKQSGGLLVYNGGKASNTVVSSGGGLTVYSGGTAGNITAKDSGGMIHVSSGGKVTGAIDLSGRATMLLHSGAFLDFDISALSPNNSFLFINCSNIATSDVYPSFVLTVSPTQAKGTYKLATKAYLFGNDNRTNEEKTLTICDNSGMKLGAVMSGKKARVGDQTYTLNLNSSGELTLTVAAYVEGEEIWTEANGDADSSQNNWLCNRKNKNPDAGSFTSTTVTSPKAVILDKALSKTIDGVVYRNFVGEKDGADYARITLEKAAKLSFTVAASGAAKFTLWQLLPGKDIDTYVQKAIKSGSLKKVSKQESPYMATVETPCLDPEGEYYISVETKDKKGAKTYYNVSVNANSVFYTRGDNSDDWDDREENGENGKVDKSLGKLNTGKITKLTDLYSDWIGFGDTVDYKRLRIQTREKLFLLLEADGVVKFTLYSLNEDNSLQKVLSTKVKKDRNAKNEYYALKDVVVGAGDYYFCVELAKPKKGGDVDYTVSVAGYSYTRGDNSDDTADKARDIGTLSIAPAQKQTGTIYSDWVGWEDEYDYMKFTLSSAARLRFHISSDEGTKFSFFAVGSEKAILKATAKKDLIVGYEATTKEALLEAGDYCICMQSTNATKYGYSDYTIELKSSVFFSDGDGRSNDILLNSGKQLDDVAKTFQPTVISGNTAILLDKQKTVSRKIDNRTYNNFVGFGDETDYGAIRLNHDGKLYFTVTANDTAKFTVYKLVAGSGKKSGTFTAKALLSGKLKKKKRETVYTFGNAKGLQLLAGENYYICVQSTNAKKSEYGTYYNISVEYEQMSVVKEGKMSDVLTGADSVNNWDVPSGSVELRQAGIELSDGRAGGLDPSLSGAGAVSGPHDDLNFSCPDTGMSAVCAECSPGALFDDRSGWENITRLA